MMLNTLSLPPSSLATRAASASVLFAGDAGETMRLAGKRFARQLARGNGPRPSAAHVIVDDSSPDDAPAFQVRFGGEPPLAAAATSDVLVAFDDAALLGYRPALANNGLLLVNATRSDTTTRFATDGHRTIAIDFDALALQAAGAALLGERDVARCRNYAALGVVCALLEQAIDDIRCRTVNTAPVAVRANRRALVAGHQLGESLAARNVPPVTARFAA